MEKLKFFGKLEYLKIEDAGNNSYNVMRRNFPFGFQKVATIKVVSATSYSYDPIEELSVDDIQYIRKEMQKILGIEPVDIRTTIY